MNHLRRCWTCKERKVRCDQGYPECSRCKKSNHKCQGYGVRLAWPKAKSGRALVGRAAVVPLASGRDKKARFINAGVWDLELYHHLSSLSGMQVEQNALARPSLMKYAPHWTPYQLGVGKETLLEYFNDVASNKLAIFDRDFKRFRNVVLRLAFSDDSPASKAVRQSLLAVSAIHRYGPSLEADRLKLSALSALNNSSEKGLDGHTGVQHVAAQLLLCSFEVKSSVAQWLWFLCGANHLVMTTNLRMTLAGGELRGILNWLAYQHVMCRFSLRNWRTGRDYWKMPWRKSLGNPPVCDDRRTMNYLPDTSYEVLSLLSDVIESVQEPSALGYHSELHAESLQQLENRLESIQVPNLAEQDIADAYTNLIELYRLASLVYLERSATGSSGPSTKIQLWLDKAYAILEKQDVSLPPFIIFVLGIESRNDEERKLFLSLIRQSDETSSAIAMENVHSMLQSVWLQDDLEIGRVLDYGLKLKAVFSANEILPSMA